MLGTLLTAVIIARGRFLRQWSEAERRLQTTKAADNLLATWMTGGRLDSRSVRVPSQGPLYGAPQRYWRTRWLNDRPAQQVQAQVVRLEVYDATRTGRSGAAGVDRVLAVDFLVHDSRNDPPPVTQPSTSKPGANARTGGASPTAQPRGAAAPVAGGQR